MNEKIRISLDRGESDPQVVKRLVESLRNVTAVECIELDRGERTIEMPDGPIQVQTKVYKFGAHDSTHFHGWPIIASFSLQIQNSMKEILQILSSSSTYCGTITGPRSDFGWCGFRFAASDATGSVDVVFSSRRLHFHIDNEHHVLGLCLEHYRRLCSHCDELLGKNCRELRQHEPSLFSRFPHKRI